MVRLTDSELNEAFLNAMGPAVLSVLDRDAPVLELMLAPPNPPRVRVYIFNATNPPGGRTTPEHKIQLAVPGQVKGERRDFDRSGDFEVLMVGKVEDVDAFVLWDSNLYFNFPHSRNVQVRTATIEKALAEHRVTTQQRLLQGRTVEEQVIATPADLLQEAVRLRFRGWQPAAAPAEQISTASHPPPLGKRQANHQAPAPLPTGGIGYVTSTHPEQEWEPEARVFQQDPNAIDRGTRAHTQLQNQLAETFRTVGLAPLSPAAGDPEFDLACRDGDVTYIVEVKSLTAENEEKQLRLGLGQVLSYAYRIKRTWSVHTIQPVLAVEHEPAGTYWHGLCDEHGVILTWPNDFPGLF